MGMYTGTGNMHRLTLSFAVLGVLSQGSSAFPTHDWFTSPTTTPVTTTLPTCNSSPGTPPTTTPSPPTTLPCDFGCDAVWEPVCGSDGKTYGNMCELAHEDCVNGPLTMAHPGECGALGRRVVVSTTPEPCND